MNNDFRVPILMLMSIIVLGVWIVENRLPTLKAVNNQNTSNFSTTSTGVLGTNNIIPASNTSANSSNGLSNAVNTGISIAGLLGL